MDVKNKSTFDNFDLREQYLCYYRHIDLDNIVNSCKI